MVAGNRQLRCAGLVNFHGLDRTGVEPSLTLICTVHTGASAALSPSIASAFNRWIPVNEKATAFGAYLAGGRLGGAITPFVAGYLLSRLAGAVSSWCGRPYLVWCLSAYRDRPQEHRHLSAELERLRNETTAGTGSGDAVKTDWRVLLASKRLWCLLGAAFGSTFLWQFYATWFPTYLREHRGMSMTESSFYASLPFMVGLCANGVGGLLTDWIGRRTDERYARTLVGLVSLVTGAALMSSGIWCKEAATAALLMGLAAGAVDLYLGAAWSSATDIGGASG
ncbi:MAG: MFS transporter, partial [Bryobacteraceae bacterium]